MSEIATAEFLAQLKNLCSVVSPAKDDGQISQELNNPWYFVAAAAFSASNRPDCVTRLFQFMLDRLNVLSASKEDKQLVVLKIREAVFKTGFVCGYPRAVSALIALYEVTPEELRDTRHLRAVEDDKVLDTFRRGVGNFTALYGEKADSVQSLFDAIHPDMGWFSKNIAFGYIYDALDILAQRETSYVIIAALIAMDTPLQITWHLNNCRRIGASREEIQGVRETAMRVASACGVKWRDSVPELRDEA